jgi:DNA-directed RNA polymerase specialized sigma24 family protein
LIQTPARALSIGGMPLTNRSRQLEQLLPALRAGVRAAHLRSRYADDALQQSLMAIVPHLGRLFRLSDRERCAYAFVLGSRTAMALRRRVGLDEASGSDDEVDGWYRPAIRAAEPTPEGRLQWAESLERMAVVVDALAPRDQELLRAVANEGLSERDAAAAAGVSRGSVAYRLRRARQALGRAWHGTTSWLRRVPDECAAARSRK